MTLRRETFQAYVLDVMDSLKAHGIKTILVMNGHGGNHQPLHEALPAWRKELGINIDADSYWSGTPQSFLKSFVRSKQLTSHAGEFETSIYMAAFPGRLRPFTMEDYDDAHLNYESDFTPEVQEFLRRMGTESAFYPFGNGEFGPSRRYKFAAAAFDAAEAHFYRADWVFLAILREKNALDTAQEPRDRALARRDKRRHVSLARFRVHQPREGQGLRPGEYLDCAPLKILERRQRIDIFGDRGTVVIIYIKGL